MGVRARIGSWVVCALLGACTEAPRAVVRTDERPALDSLGPAVALHTEGGYVGSEACAQCHEATHASWTRSYHRTMTQRPSAAAIAGRFDDAALDRAGHYRALRRGEAFMVTQPAADGSVREQRVELVTGSHHMQIYWVAGERGALEAFAFAFLLPEQRWVPNEWTLLRPPHPADALAGDAVEAVYTWNRVCVKCHAVDGNPGFDARTGAVESSVAELGIACEACHGPAGEHVGTHRARAEAGRPPRQSDAGDPTIVQPRALGAAGASQVCAQCHSISLFHDDDAWVARGRTERSPAPISGWGRVVRHPLREHGAWTDAVLDTDPDFFAQRYWSDGEVRVSGREYNGLLESPCSVSPDFGCTSCHRMHESALQVEGRAWVEGQLREGARTGRVCGRCHEAISADPAAHARHPGASVDCLDCHMPRTTYGLLGAIRSHTITSPDLEASLTTGRPLACNLCHLDRSLQWASDALTTDFGLPAVELPGEQGPAVVQWLLAGDAGQRAIAAWHLGWAPALEASQAPWAAGLLDEIARDDPYPAVRLVAERARRALGVTAQPAGGLDSTWLESLRSRRDDRPVRLAE